MGNRLRFLVTVMVLPSSSWYYLPGLSVMAVPRGELSS